jgi:hypothetical protein
MERRDFLRMIAGCGVASFTTPAETWLADEGNTPAFFGLHPFIEAHPEAVFIFKTNVASKNDSEAKLREGFRFANQIFTARNTPGIPVSHKIAIKPNLTGTRATGLTHAIVTDPFLVEGVVEKLKQTGIPAGNIFLREGLSEDQPGLGYSELAKRSGVHYADEDSRLPTVKECPDGVVFRRTKYLGPFNYPNSYLINISKFKAHPMGLTLCVKNLQGTNMQPYIQFCFPPVKKIIQDFQPGWEKQIADLHARHEKAGLPRWYTEKGPYMERWVQRTLDHYSLIRPTLGLNIIEGIYGQNGDGFTIGPSATGCPDIFMTNMLIFGIDAFRVDIVGHWLGGHEPGNFGLFHIARERGVSTALNPKNIPVYLWEENGPQLTPIEKFSRTPLATPYMAKANEAAFHLCNEPFSYPAESTLACLSGGEVPDSRVLGQTRKGNGQTQLVIEYNLPLAGYAALDLYNSNGSRIARLTEGCKGRGIHLASWNTGKIASGKYFCRLRTDGFDQARPVYLAG